MKKQLLIFVAMLTVSQYSCASTSVETPDPSTLPFHEKRAIVKKFYKTVPLTKEKESTPETQVSKKISAVEATSSEEANQQKNRDIQSITISNNTGLHLNIVFADKFTPFLKTAVKDQSFFIRGGASQDATSDQLLVTHNLLIIQDAAHTELARFNLPHDLLTKRKIIINSISEAGWFGQVNNKLSISFE